MFSLYGAKEVKVEPEKYCCGLLTKKDPNERPKDQEEIEEEERLNNELMM
jgi:adenylyl- and sulfurtransferase ThiI